MASGEVHMRPAFPQRRSRGPEPADAQGRGGGGEDQTQSLELLVSLEETHSPLAQKIKFRGKRGVLIENVIFGIKDPSVHSHKPSFTTLPG